MFRGLLNIIYLDYAGSEIDLDFMYKDKWLKNTAVTAQLQNVAGEWKIYLVMTHIENPYQFYSRCINSCSSKQKAETFAEMYVRTAQKDARGSLQINYEDFNICFG